MTMGAPLLGKHFAELQSASTPAVVVAAAGSFAGQVAAVMQAAPLWVYLLAAVAPWFPILFLELVWTYRHYRWLAIFCLLIVTQTGYLLEHVARMVQVHILSRDPVEARGIFGALDAQRVEFIWTSWAVLGVLLLISRFPRNPWLWLTLLITAWDVVDAQLGVTNLWLAREQVDVHFAYAIAGIVALNLAFALQLGRTYDAWLARAFPQLPEQLLIDATGRLEEVRLRPGERVEHGSERLYIVTRGTGMLVREGPGGHEILLRVLAPGQVVRDGGTLRAETALEMLALPASAI
jgi:hypothetical protein